MRRWFLVGYFVSLWVLLVLPLNCSETGLCLPDFNHLRDGSVMWLILWYLWRFKGWFWTFYFLVGALTLKWLSLLFLAFSPTAPEWTISFFVTLITSLCGIGFCVLRISRPDQSPG